MIHDLIGIGAGVFNLSLAALLNDVGHDSHVFLEEKPSFSWYPGLDTDVSELQDDFLGDLVTLVNPTSRFSFLSYLHARGIIYQFIGRKSSPLSRRIYSQYFSWASQQLSSIQWSSAVRSVQFDSNRFIIKTDEQEFFSRNLVIGVGIKPKLPSFTQELLSQNVYHASAYSARNSNLTDKTVAVIGGGQSSAEVLLDIVMNHAPRKIIWISPRSYHATIEWGDIISDFWSPTFVTQFYQLGGAARERLNKDIYNISDAISSSTLNELYRRLFDSKYFEGAGFDQIILTSARLTDARKILGTDTVQIRVRNDLTTKRYEFVVDELILATGYVEDYQNTLSDLIKKFPTLSEANNLNSDFSLKWEFGSRNRIYVQNGAVAQYSIMEKSLLLASWRSAIIINSLLSREALKTSQLSIHTYHDDIERFEIKSGET